MNRDDLQLLSDIRLREARVLLAASAAPGAYYLAGYAVEAALKACIAKATREHEFPDLGRVKDAWNHDLVKLIKTAGLYQQLETDMTGVTELAINWNTVKDWSEKARYDATLELIHADELIAAIDDPRHGILQWLKQRW